ncbi:MAG: GNAT family N-acetyltransferase [Candidatus Thiodiazotropha sp. (ex Rostrolucina anterorostrata)]|nr:GNAT family N-acetyltransferase [Candidatus Thiodiazotropha sp. (ex Rostrolucina anterorostrata)]
MALILLNIDKDDLVACSELYVNTFYELPWNEEWNTEDIFERLSDFLVCPNTVAIKFVHQGNISGFLLGEIQQWNGDKIYYLKEICVSQTIQRNGIDRSLMGELEEILKKYGVAKTYLTTQRNSVPSKFYSSIGFSVNTSVLVMDKSLEKNG